MIWLPRTAILLLAVALSGNPGMTGPVPGTIFVAFGFLLILTSYVLYRYGWPFRRATWTSLLLGLVSVLSSLHSPAPYLTILGLASLAGFIAVVAGLETSIRSREQWRETAGLAVLLAATHSLYSLYTWLAAGGNTALKGNFTNADTFSVLPLLGFFLALGLAVESQNRSKYFFAICSGLFAMAVLLSASRAALAGGTLGYAAFLFTLASSRSSQIRSTAVKLLVLPLLVLLALLASGTEIKMFERLENLSTGNDPASLASRWDVVRHGYKTVLKSPLVGSGLGCFHLAYQRDRTILSADEDYMNVAHNDYMQWFVETGLIGGGLWILLLLSSLRTAWRSYRSPTPWVAGQIGATISVGIFCVFNFACPVPADFLWIAVSLGLSNALTPTLGDAATPQMNPKAFPFAAVLVVWGLVTIKVGIGAIAVQRLEAQALAYEKSLDWEAAFTSLERAGQKVPDDFRIQLKLDELAKKIFLFSGDLTWHQTRYRCLQKAFAANPKDLQTLLTMIRYLDDSNRSKEATTYVAIAEQEAPYSPLVQRAKARNQILLGQFGEAVATLSSIEKTGKAANDQALGALIYLLEAKGKGQGSDLLVKMSAQNPKRALSLGLGASEVGFKAKDYNTSLRLLRRLRYAQPERGVISWQLAQVYRQTKNDAEEIKVLNKLRMDRDLDLDHKTQEEVWQRWCELHTKRGEIDLVLAKLDDYLLTHQRLIWPRQMMAELYLKRDQKSEARAALREGIQYDVDGNLRIQLADLCASQGFADLARSYYREALAVTSHKAMVEKRLVELKKAAGPSEEEVVLEPEPATPDPGP